MAVAQIPVVVDVEKAFDDAAKRVASAIRPFKKEIEEETAKIQLKVGSRFNEDLQMWVPIKKSLQDIVGLTAEVNRRTGKTTYRLTSSMKELNVALEDAKKQYSTLNTYIQKGLSVDYSRLDAAREAITVLMSEIELRQRDVRLVEQETQRQIAATNAINDGNYALIRESKTISELSEKISMLRGKLDNLDPKSKEWTSTAKEIKKATTELNKYEEKLQKILKPGDSGKVGSIERIKNEMRDVVSQWDSMSARVKFDPDGRLSKKAQDLINKYKQLAQESERYGRSIDSYVKKATTGGNQILGVLNRVAAGFGVYVSVFSLGRFVRQLRDVTGELEYQRVALGRLIQDEEYGAQLFERIKKAAVESPFRIKDLVTYTKQLAAYRVSQEDLFDVMHRLADVSAGLGVDMNRLILAYGQVKAASVLRGQELRQFTEAGIPLVELLAEKFSDLRGEMVSTSEVFKLISARAVPFSMISDIFEDMTDAGGMFYQMQEKQAKTLQGRWEKLKDTFDIALQSIGDTKTFRKENDAVLWSLNKLAEALVLIPKLLRGVTYGYLTYVTISKAISLWNNRHIIQEKIIAAQLARRKKASAGVTFAEILRAKQSNLLARAEARLAAASNGVTTALNKMWIAMLKNPITAFIAGVTALSVAFFSFNKNADETSGSIVKLDETIDKFYSTLKETNKLEKLIKNYETLGTKTERSEKETARLEQTIRRLQILFPELSLSIQDDTKKLNENAAAMRKNNEERLKQARDAAELDLSLAEGNLAVYEKKRAEIFERYRSTATAEKISRGASWFLQWISGIDNEKVRSKANELKEQLDELDKKITDTQKDVERLRKYLYPEEKQIAGWKELLGTLQTTTKGAQLFSPEQLDNWNRLYDVSNDLEKEWKKMKEDIDGLKAAMPKPGEDNFADWAKDLELAEDKLAGLVLIMETFGFHWGKQTKVSYQKDAFITVMENRMKFMKDFKKGYDDLSKFLSKDKALRKEFGFMQGRGLSLGLAGEEQKSAAEGLSNWYTNQIKAVMLEMRKKGIKGNTVTEFLSQQFKGEGNRAKMLRDYQALLQSLWDAKTDFDTSEVEKNMELALKRLEENLKRSETVNNFYRDILDMTGDKDLAQNLTISVYGDAKGIGKEFKDRIQEELIQGLNTKDLWGGKIDEDLKNELTGLVTVFDVDEIRKNLDKLPPKLKELFQTAIKSNEQYDENWYKDFIKTFKKAKTYEERVNTLEAQREEKLRQARDRKASKSDKDAIEAHYAKEIANVQLEAMKDTYTWTKAFEDLDGISSQTLENLITLIDRYVSKYGKDLEPQQLKELTRAKESAEAQKLKRNAYAGVIQSLKDVAFYTNRANELSTVADDADDEYIKAQDAKQKALYQLSEALDLVNADMNALIDSTSHLMSAFASDDNASYFSQQMGNLSSAFSAASKAGTGLAALGAGVINPQTIMQTVTGIADLVASIFDIGNASDIRRAENNIKYQQRLLEDLEHTYSRLEKAEEKAFGADYISSYNQRLSILEAQQLAYQRQADAERSKGKKADEDRIREYENSARDAMDKLSDMQSEVSEKFLGTDLGSAARDFASSWIDAYKEFGSTTDAMSEKFSDMIQNMIVESMAAKIVQGQLAPIFDMIDTLASDDGQFSAMDAAMVANKTKETVGTLNTGLTNLMNALGGAGINIRQMGTGLTGISKDIQGASEESILGLAAGVNTQNYYMSHIDANVAAIVAYLTGGATPAAGQGGVPLPTNYQEDMLSYAAHIPTIEEKLSALLTAVNNVVHPNNTPSSYYVATRM